MTKDIDDFIFDEQGVSDGWQTTYTYDDVKKISSQFAKQEAIAFTNWVGENGYAYIGGVWYHMDDEDGSNKLSESDLWELYQQSKTQ